MDEGFIVIDSDDDKVEDGGSDRPPGVEGPTDDGEEAESDILLGRAVTVDDAVKEPDRESLADIEADKLVALGVTETDTEAESAVELRLADAETEADKLVALVVTDAEIDADKLVALVVRETETEAERAVELVVADKEDDMTTEVGDDVGILPLLMLRIVELRELLADPVFDPDWELVDPEAGMGDENPEEVEL